MDSEIDVDRHYVRSLDGSPVRLPPTAWPALYMLYAVRGEVVRTTAIFPNGSGSHPREMVRQMRKKLAPTPWRVSIHPLSASNS
jgi:hypothetical protein